MSSRLRTTLDAVRHRGGKAMGIFLTNGFPEPAATVPLMQAIDESGADFIELGMPFSDPLAEGLPIQRASARALAHGVKMTDAFEAVAAFRAHAQTPVLLMGYINPVFRYGIGNFCRDARSSGVDGLILPDVPLGEADLIDAAAHEAGLDVVHLIAPNTPTPRMAEIDQRATGFVYAVSITGLTGAALHGLDGIAAYLKEARRHVTQNPLLVGFGISSHERAMALSTHTDGFIVGSALVAQIESLWEDTALTDADRLAYVGAFIQGLKYGPVAYDEV